jgi:hypothetical protein
MKKKPKQHPTNSERRALPKVNVDFANGSGAGEMTAEQLRSLICNPIYAGMGRFPAWLDDETWVRAAVQMIEKEGAEQFRVNMLYVLRQLFGTGVRGSKDDHEVGLGR